ncbi:LuxR C-terminal-related transcriptional regulator [Peristeroidobacter soli]|uniref:LuxR C-terminal-related transcriptional regulator n=1 Tax=Peristeroidobacter soli TaxID=2497877 RepID=UPI00158CF457|nr:LuxR C-terminal-related transcriptional regulator [Peristeroidobacter soli]
MLRPVPGGGAKTSNRDNDCSPFAFELLARPAIERRLDSVLAHAVTVLEAPAGYGKTATLWQWYQAARHRSILAAQVSLNELARDPERFVAQMNAALRPAGIRIEDSSWQGVTRRSLILIDDYPMGAAELDEAFGTLMRSLPSELHVVVASRAPIRWPLFKLLLEGHVQCLTSEDLRFSAAEVGQYLQPHGFSVEDLQTLEDSVQGWQAALHVLRLGCERRATAGFSMLAPPELAIRYVMEQVLDTVPKPVIEMLIVMAAVERSNALLLDHIRDAENSDRLLKNALECGVPLLLKQGWYSLHPFMQACLAREVARLGEAQRRKLHLRAHQWFLEAGDIEAAVHHARMAGDPRKIFETIESIDGIELALRDGATALERVFQQLPQQLLCEFPRAAIARSFLLAKNGRLHEARRILETLQSAANASPGLSPQVLQRLSVAHYFLAFAEDRTEAGHDEADLQQKLLQTSAGYDPCTQLILNLALCNARLRRGDLVGATNSALEADFWCKEANTPYAANFAIHRLGASYIYRNKLHLARECFERTMPIVAALQSKEPQLQLLADTLGIAVYFDQNDLPTSYQMLDRLLPRIDQLECSVHTYMSANIMASRMEYMRKGLGAALEILAHAARFGERRQLPGLCHAIDVQRAELLARAGQGEQALAQLAQLGVQMKDGQFLYPTSHTWLELTYDGLALTRALLAAGDAHGALSICTTVNEQCARIGAFRFLLRGRLLEALAYDALGESEQAVEALRSALDIAVPEHTLRPFLDEGEPMQKLLKQLIRVTGVNQVPGDTVDFIAAVLGTSSSATTSSALPGNSILSPREHDVLAQLADGHSNKLIARKLDLTENTVKFHLRGLYEKLGVSCRVLAVSVARGKGILAT